MNKNEEIELKWKPMHKCTITSAADSLPIRHLCVCVYALAGMCTFSPSAQGEMKNAATEKVSTKIACTNWLRKSATVEVE